MNKLCTLLLMLFCLASLPVQAAEEEDHGLGFWVEAGTASRGNASWLTGYWDHSFTDTLGVYALVDVESDGYREFYVGPKVKLTEWLEVGVGVGRESIRGELRGSPRRNVWAAIETERFSIYVTAEDGGSGPWHKAYALYKVTDSFSAGVMNEKRFGTGPRIEYVIANNVTAWAAALRKDKETTTLLAVNFSF